MDTRVFHLASATLATTMLSLFGTPVLADLVTEDGPAPATFAPPSLVETGRIDASVKSYVSWLAGRPERKEAKRLAALPAVRRAPSVPYEAGNGRCGGDLPSCSIMMCESKGNIRAENPTSSASGKWQFLDSSWGNHGGYARASDAPESVQDEKARQMWAGGSGASHWRQCW